MKVLIIGSGGREHALAWKLSSSKRVSEIYVAPGNGGTAEGIPKVSNVDIDVEDFPALVEFATRTNIGLAVPGPEAPLVGGIEGHFRKVGVPCFGPSKEAARMEGSKAFSKDFMQRHNIPTAAYRNFTQYEEAKTYLDAVSHPVVIKASGLAAGKGVIIPSSKEEAYEALLSIMVRNEFGSAGNEVVIEELLEGEELSILAFSDGYTVISLPPAQDHKRIADGDRGPNTGGMGCYAPTRIASPENLQIIKQTILQPTIDGMRREGFPFKGMLFTGLMMTQSGPKVLEYNVRFGDPETQTVLPLLGNDTDLAEVMLAAVNGYLDSVQISVKPEFGVTVVVAAGGYPGTYGKGLRIKINPVAEGVQIFHAGTTLKNGAPHTAGGRVIASSACAMTLEDAVKLAYEGVKAIQFEKMHYRTDIAHRAFKHTTLPLQFTYEAAGVSVDAGNEFVQRIKAAVRSTKTPGAAAEIGGFGGIFDLQAAGYENPLLVAGIDGVGTKLKIACSTGKHETVGIDLVAMSVNDLLAQGAEPLFFLDYYATSKLRLKDAQAFVEGVAKGCRIAGCALIGGETAEMPGMYTDGDYDAAGCAVGAVDRQNLLPKTKAMVSGDALIGISSNGAHSNGYSLIRKIVEKENLEWDEPAPWDSTATVADALLTPTRIYVKPIIKLIKQNLIKGLSHITGGGLTDNVPRMLPDGLAASIDVSTWELSPLFSWLKRAGNISASELARTWNVGVGFVLVVSESDQQNVLNSLKADGEGAFRIGQVITRNAEDAHCTLAGVESWD